MIFYHISWCIMREGARFQAISDIIEGWLNKILHDSANDNMYHVPAFDVYIATYVKAHRYMGKKDRDFIREHAYNIIRHYMQLTQLAVMHNTHYTSCDITWLYIIYIYKLPIKDAANLTAKPYGLPSMPIYIAQEYDDILYKHQHYNDYNISPALYAYCQNAHSTLNLADIPLLLQAPRSLHIRVNKHLMTRDDALAALQADGIEAAILPDTSYGIALNHNTISNHILYKNGYIDVQSREAQLACAMLSIKPSMTILDYCAGAGGKALNIGASYNNIDIYVHDPHKKRLQQAFKRASIQHITLTEWQTSNKPHHHDIVMVDAPCSGSGNWHIYPEQALFFKDNTCMYYQNKQYDILTHAGSHTAINGQLAYMTCSIFDEENGDIVQRFINNNPNFRVEDTHHFSPINGDMHGFYVAIMRRIS